MPPWGGESGQAPREAGEVDLDLLGRSLGRRSQGRSSGSWAGRSGARGEV